MYKLENWGRRFHKLIGRDTSFTNVDIWVCGLKFRDKWGKFRTIIMKMKVLAAAEDNLPLLSFVEIEEVTAIFKKDYVWYCACHLKDGIDTIRAYFSRGPKKEAPDLLSQRELQILKLAALRKSINEIGEMLDIQKNTVLRHRKNMIARVGVVDFTSLIRIGQILGMI